MHLQRDKEFNQNKIKQLNKKIDVEMYELRGEKLLLQNRKFENIKRFY